MCSRVGTRLQMLKLAVDIETIRQRHIVGHFNEPHPQLQFCFWLPAQNAHNLCKQPGLSWQLAVNFRHKP